MKKNHFCNEISVPYFDCFITGNFLVEGLFTFPLIRAGIMSANSEGCIDESIAFSMIN